MEKYKYKTRSMSSITPCPHGVTAEFLSRDILFKDLKKVFSVTSGWMLKVSAVARMRKNYLRF